MIFLKLLNVKKYYFNFISPCCIINLLLRVFFYQYLISLVNGKHLGTIHRAINLVDIIEFTYFCVDNDKNV